MPQSIIAKHGKPVRTLIVHAPRQKMCAHLGKVGADGGCEDDIVPVLLPAVMACSWRAIAPSTRALRKRARRGW